MEFSIQFKFYHILHYDVFIQKLYHSLSVSFVCEYSNTYGM